MSNILLLFKPDLVPFDDHILQIALGEFFPLNIDQTTMWAILRNVHGMEVSITQDKASLIIDYCEEGFSLALHVASLHQQGPLWLGNTSNTFLLNLSKNYALSQLMSPGIEGQFDR